MAEEVYLEENEALEEIPIEEFNDEIIMDQDDEGEEMEEEQEQFEFANDSIQGFFEHKGVFIWRD
jgi:hypothetical protein